MAHLLLNFKHQNYKIVKTLDDDLIFIATIKSSFKICISAVQIILDKMNSTNWPAPNVWFFIAQMVKQFAIA